MSLPITILPVRQRDDGDCGIAALATLLNKDYMEVADAGRRIGERLHKRGVWIPEVVKIAKLLGAKLKPRRVKGLPEEPTGLLRVALPQDRNHLVVLFAGVLYDPWNGLVWEPEEYLRSVKAKPTTFYVLL